MALKLMYITNNQEVAKIAEESGVDIIFLDMEYIGKEKRQAGLDTVKLKHSFDDIRNVKSVLNSAAILVRINPYHEKTDSYIGTKCEVDEAIDAGCDYIMLPMFREKYEVENFIKIVDGRVRTVLLVETISACENIDEILTVHGIDCVHIGLNDLHLEYKMKFMFELLADGTVEKLCNIIKKSAVTNFGFGGIARIGHGILPSEIIIGEHYRLGSSMAILSRSFCDANKLIDYSDLSAIFSKGIEDIRNTEWQFSKYSQNDFYKNNNILNNKIAEIVEVI
ncbi:MAG: aldolase/citrate lyase family protein [Bacillota bacterium]